MGFALGFGSTEQTFEEGEERAIRDYLIDNTPADPSYFDDKFIKQVEAWLKARAEGYHAKAREYKAAADYPSRYSHYWPYVLGDANYIVVILSIHHVNRRHAMSPDGWALMQTKPVFAFSHLDIEDAARRMAA